TLPYSLDPAESGAIQRRGDLFWLVGYSVLLLEPSLILLTVRLPVVALVWLALWLSYIYLTLHEYRKALKQRVRLTPPVQSTLYGSLSPDSLDARLDSTTRARWHAQLIQRNERLISEDSVPPTIEVLGRDWLFFTWGP